MGAQKELPTKDADGNGMISAQCCTKMAPLVTENCMCTWEAMNIVYDSLKGRDITDLNPYVQAHRGRHGQSAVQRPGKPSVLPFQRVSRLPALGPVLRSPPALAAARSHPLLFASLA